MAPLCPVRILLTGPNRYVGRILRAVVLRQGHTMTVAVRDAARTRILLNVPITRRRDYPDY